MARRRLAAAFSCISGALPSILPSPSNTAPPSHIHLSPAPDPHLPHAKVISASRRAPHTTYTRARRPHDPPGPRDAPMYDACTRSAPMSTRPPLISSGNSRRAFSGPDSSRALVELSPYTHLDAPGPTSACATAPEPALRSGGGFLQRAALAHDVAFSKRPYYSLKKVKVSQII
ncbi:hypothetical protein HYPSUDRAFT_208114 [Hypholoma sublateritium FD-334 SS-4]|uniref:Uncharacterized protein n=1 Tax=Hypholoma sublateritium (strain FD-334 SS-4) TaxID=945553 RepID=A0A0D2KKD7_HYPSF|nr:hypothetical protein HYPSUDRAFT_208114 [Hypholoma sublateritium FD-334 SS-4]